MLEHRMRGSIRALSGCGRRVVRRRGKVAGVRPCPSSLMTALDVSHPSDPGRDRLLARLSDGRPTSIRRVGWSGPRPHGRCGGRAPRGDKAPSRRPSTGHCTADRSVRTRSASLQRTPSFRWPEPSARKLRSFTVGLGADLGEPPSRTSSGSAACSVAVCAVVVRSILQSDRRRPLQLMGLGLPVPSSSLDKSGPGSRDSRGARPRRSPSFRQRLCSRAPKGPRCRRTSSSPCRPVPVPRNCGPSPGITLS